ncbi:hypothetical protein BUALT_Bualt08G0141600 [Buddleja alternifolia]|uniref:NPF family transporter n=1 Tax=Buddleja alternifolia TaxID=168488 RepID=A0AAV6XDB2_9LAMI|nr:hypothetical protein BUALT_Bualt08G0141600 [Buddleja alternifolia]
MAITVFKGDDMSDSETPLLNDDVVPGSVDFKCRPSVRSKSGSWKSASLLIGVEIAERFWYSGISSNLIGYLTGALGQSTAAAAANLNVWFGTATLSPIVGAFVADSFLGRYWTIIFSSLLYIMGLGFLTISASLNLSSYSDCKSAGIDAPCSPPPFQKIFFFFSLYLIAIVVGGHTPCMQSFGADQFDVEDKKECVAKSSFFNWWVMLSCSGSLLGYLIMNYIQENLSWELGFGIPCIVMCFSLIIFLLGTKTYRFPINNDERRNPFVRISRIIMRAARSCRLPFIAPISNEQEVERNLPLRCIGDNEEVNLVFRLAPIWFTSLGYAVVFAQPTTLFTKQAATVDRHISSTIQIPAATFQSFIVGSIVVFIPFYDRIFVPIARAITKKPSGISMLQRIGTGIFLSLVSIVVAALVEKKRLAVAAENGMVDMPNAIVPMSVWWLVPQYMISGIADVFTMAGLQEFFYDQVPSALKATGIALYISVLGIGNFLSSFLIFLVEKATRGNGRDGWFADNLNRAHLDYFYWLLAGISAFSFAAYVYYAKSYIYIRGLTV